MEGLCRGPKSLDQLCSGRFARLYSDKVAHCSHQEIFRWPRLRAPHDVGSPNPKSYSNQYAHVH